MLITGTHEYHGFHFTEFRLSWTYLTYIHIFMGMFLFGFIYVKKCRINICIIHV